jgi:hypothetical protein
MINSLTIFFPYYNQPSALQFQLNHYSHMPKHIRNKIKIFIVDDGSQIEPALNYINNYLELLDITLYRIDIDIPWNQAETNNLAFENINTDFLIRLDIDSYFNYENLNSILNLNIDNKSIIKFNYRSATTNELVGGEHPNVFLINKHVYKKYKYNEYFSGNYGYEDIDFINNLSHAGYKFINFKLEHIINNDQFSTSNLNRNALINENKLNEINRPFLTNLHRDYYRLLINNSKIIKLIGLMLTRDDVELLEDWLIKYRKSFNDIYALDGSINYKEKSKEILLNYNVKYYHDELFNFTNKSDQVLRGVIFDEIKKNIQNNDNYNDYWIVCIHPDEFYIENLNQVIQKAYNVNTEVIIYNALHNFPHVSEKEQYLKENTYKVLNHFIHNGSNTFKENRIFKYKNNLMYSSSHVGVLPFNVNYTNSQKFHPNYLHYKIQTINTNDYDENGTIKKSVWSGLASHYPPNHKFKTIDNFFLEVPSGDYAGQHIYIKDTPLPLTLEMLRSN